MFYNLSKKIFPLGLESRYGLLLSFDGLIEMHTI